MKKYTITMDYYENDGVFAVCYDEGSAINAHCEATKLYNQINNLQGDDCYIDYNHRDIEDKDMSFEEWVAGCDAIWCEIEENSK